VSSHPDHAAATARRRLARIQGQLGGILTMIEEGRRCEEVVQQIAAAGKALDRVGVSLVVSQLQHCVEDDGYAAEQGYDREKVERLFMSLT